MKVCAKWSSGRGGEMLTKKKSKQNVKLNVLSWETDFLLLLPLLPPSYPATAFW